MTIATRINHALWPHAGAALVSLLALAACGPEGIVEGAGGAAEDVLEIDEGGAAGSGILGLHALS